MDAQPRQAMIALRRGNVPVSAGVYAVYRDQKRVYIGMAGSLQTRVWGNHSGRGSSMGSSAMRRNVAEHLGYGAASDIKKGLVKLTAAQLELVRQWLDQCEIAWLECRDDLVARHLENQLKLEFKPPLTKR